MSRFGVDAVTARGRAIPDRANLARYKVPGRIHCVAELARTTVGRIDRIALRQRLAAEA